MMISAQNRMIATLAIVLASTNMAHAQRRGGGGGGRGGMVAPRGPVARPAPAFRGSPSVSTPRMERPNVNMNREMERPNINRGEVNRGEVNRGEINRGEINRGEINRGEVNRGEINRGEINRGEINRGEINNRERINANVNNQRVNNVGNRSNNVTEINRVTNINNGGNRGPGGGWGYNGNRGSGWGGYGGGYHPNPYQGYHAGWVHGSWNNHYLPLGGYGGYGGWGGYGYGFNNGYGNYFGGNGLLGLGLGIGVASWGLAALSNSWGYSRYANPYYSGVGGGFGAQPGVVASSFYDYSQPLNLTAPPPAEGIVNQAVATLDDARSAFSAGDYARAIQMTDQAISQTPNDPMLHEFRAICLFALGKYDEAAIPLYTVLSSGPGWDWTTLIGLYPNVDVYTQQLRALEDYCNRTPQAASARFVLASLYMTQGNNAEAAAKYREVAAIRPQDKLSGELASAISSAKPDPNSPPIGPPQANASQPPPPPTDPNANAQPPADPTPAAGTAPANAPPLPKGPVPAQLVGSWTATPAKDVTITLAFVPDGNFTWKVTDRGQTRELQGPAKFDDNTLALLAPDQPPMVAKLDLRDGGHFHFKPVGAPSQDPGLDFAK